MKKKTSIFWRITLIILPLAILADALALFSAYNYVSTTTYEHFINAIKNTATITDELLGEFDLDPANNDAEGYSKALSELCGLLDTLYIYVLEIDEEKESEKYLAIGINEDSPEGSDMKRKPGDVVTGYLTQQQLYALNNPGEYSTIHEKNENGDSLICYFRRSSDKFKNEIIGVEVSVSSVTNELNRNFRYAALLTLFVTSAFVAIFAIIIHRQVQKPAHIISKKMNSFVHDRKEGFEKLEVDGSREFAEMADSFNSMAEEIDDYLNRISKMNRQKAELSIARDIQNGLLQPADFETGSVSISACMLPAQDVGGDLYDYFELDDGKIFVSIADVSGKGIAASLFMARAVTLLHLYAEAGMSPGKVLYEYNNHLAANNPNMLFITTFTAVYDPETNELVYANAGHNTPFLISDRLIGLDGEFGMAAGIFMDEKYPEHTVKVKVGDILYLYTDGVTEARSKDDMLFSDEALENELTTLTGASEEEVVSSVLEKLKAFTEGAEQADDITMLAMKITPHSYKRLSLDAKTENLTVIYSEIAQLPVPDEIKHTLRFIAEEMFVNICSYAYPNGQGKADIIIEADNERAVLTFIDSGVHFDPTADIPGVEDYDIDNTVGGLGRFLTFSFADDCTYVRRGENNVLKITKYIQGEAQPDSAT